MDDWRTRMEVDAYKRADLIRRAEQERLVQQAQQHRQNGVRGGDGVGPTRWTAWLGMVINFLAGEPPKRLKPGPKSSPRR